jgi:hypothetical protein
MHPADRGSGRWPLEIRYGIYNFASRISAGCGTSGGLRHDEERLRFCSTQYELVEIQLDQLG